MFTCDPPSSRIQLLCGVLLTFAHNNATAFTTINPYQHQAEPYGYQSVQSQGNDIAASIVRSNQNDQGFFATGSTTGMLYNADVISDKKTFHGGMHCYLMQIKPFGEDAIWTKKFGALRFDEPTTTTCTSVMVIPGEEDDEQTKIVVVGYTQGDVLFNPHDGRFEFSEMEHENNAAASLNKVNGFAMMLTVPRFVEELYDDGPDNVPNSEIYDDGAVPIPPNSIPNTENFDDGPDNKVMPDTLPAFPENDDDSPENVPLKIINPDVVAEDEEEPDDIHVLAGRMLNMDKITYPVSVTSVGHSDFVVVSMVSDDVGVNLDAAVRESTGDVGDLDSEFQFGTSFKIKVERLSFDHITGKVIKKWSEGFTTDDDSGAIATSIVYDRIQNSVTISGSTRGQGDAFGRMDASRSGGGDMDGYVFTLNADTGGLNRDKSVRIVSVPGKQEIVSGICKKDSGDSIYVVGSTNAILDSSFVPAYEVDFSDRKFNAFLRKINLSNMSTVWTRQLGSVNIRDDKDQDDQDVFGMGCAVDELEPRVYLTGTVSAGASVEPYQLPKGNQDVFVTAFQSTHGTPLDNFPTRQVGSYMDEYVAKDGGGITTDEFGNAVLFGTTKGDFIQEKPTKQADFEPTFADVFVMSFLVSDAEHVAIVERGNSGVTATVVNKIPAATSTSEGKSAAKVVAISLLGSAAVILVFLLTYKYDYKRNFSNNGDFQTDQDISKYLEEFERGEGKGLAAGAGDTNPDSSVSSLFGQNFAMGRRNSADETASAKASDVKDDKAGTAMSYEEMMESYNSITAGEDKGLMALS